MSGAPPRSHRSFSARAEAIEPFLAMEILERAEVLEREGAQIAHLELGEPDFAPPQAATRACAEALARGDTGYTDSRGIWPLRQAISADLERRFGRSVAPERILVTQGTSSAMMLVFSLLIDPGDEVIIPTPHYPCYPNFVRFAGGVPVFVETRADSRWHVDPERVRAAITERTRAIVLGSPANPTGAVQPREVVEALANLGPTLVSDEIYDGLVYDDVRTTSALEVSDRAFVLDGCSKRYAMTGFRLGGVIAPEAAMRRLQILHQNFFISATHFVQYAGIAALEEGRATTRSMVAAYSERRTQLVDGLRHLGFGVEQLPEGAFYVLADASRFASDSRALAFELLEKAHVGVTPGIDFGQAAEGKLRFCYAVAPSVIEAGLARLEPVLAELAQRAGPRRGSVDRGTT
jgi:aspartate/methionine/tyrosine aminotransferase